MLRKLQNVSPTSSASASYSPFPYTVTAYPSLTPSATFVSMSTTNSATPSAYPSYSVYVSISPYASISQSLWSTATATNVPPYSASPSGYPSVSNSPGPLNNFLEKDYTIQGKYILSIIIPIFIVLVGLMIYVNCLYKKNQKLRLAVQEKRVINPIYPIGRTSVRQIVTVN
jgi:hypothetical protein